MGRRLNSVLWYGLHLLSYPAFVLVTAHGLMAGSDTNAPWMLPVYGVCAVAALVLFIARFSAPKGTVAGPGRPWLRGALAGGAFGLMVFVLLAVRLG